ncbi:MAG: PIN domain-containing protein [Caulobacteraceae bacterium]|nr:PIN domain-containing protein [Caulobacteraceae bacterium]
MRLALDTNILVYAEGLVFGPDDGAKHAMALRLLENARDEVLVVARQSLAELHRVMVRKARLSPEEASRRVGLWSERVLVIDTDAMTFEAALELSSDHGLQIFDAIILAAAVEGRCDLLLSEDLQDGFAWRGVGVSNPFGAKPERRLARLLA